MLFRKRSFAAAPIQEPSQFAVVLKHKLSNKAERIQFFTHAQYGNSFRCLASIFEFEQEYANMDKKTRMLHSRKLLSMYVESGARFEISTISKELRATTMLTATANNGIDMFISVKRELLRELEQAMGGGGESPHTSYSSTSCASSSVYGSPSLVFGEEFQRVIAVLDDNAMVRYSITKLLPSLLNAHAKSFVRGKTKEECMKFVDEICLNQVDLVIVDENLDFEEDNYIEFGHVLGKLARERGFQGCLILHTTLPQAALPLEQLENVFDGYVAKCEGRQFADQVNEIWQAFAKRM